MLYRSLFSVVLSHFFSSSHSFYLAFSSVNKPRKQRTRLERLSSFPFFFFVSYIFLLCFHCWYEPSSKHWVSISFSATQNTMFVVVYLEANADTVRILPNHITRLPSVVYLNVYETVHFLSIFIQLLSNPAIPAIQFHNLFPYNFILFCNILLFASVSTNDNKYITFKSWHSATVFICEVVKWMNEKERRTEQWWTRNGHQQRINDKRQQWQRKFYTIFNYYSGEYVSLWMLGVYYELSQLDYLPVSVISILGLYAVTDTCLDGHMVRWPRTIWFGQKQAVKVIARGVIKKKKKKKENRKNKKRNDEGNVVSWLYIKNRTMLTVLTPSWCLAAIKTYPRVNTKTLLA